MPFSTKTLQTNRARFYHHAGLAATFGLWSVLGIWILLDQYPNGPGRLGWFLAGVVVFLVLESIYHFLEWVALLPESMLREQN